MNPNARPPLTFASRPTFPPDPTATHGFPAPTSRTGAPKSGAPGGRSAYQAVYSPRPSRSLQASAAVPSGPIDSDGASSSVPGELVSADGAQAARAGAASARVATTARA